MNSIKMWDEDGFWKAFNEMPAKDLPSFIEKEIDKERRKFAVEALESVRPNKHEIEINSWMKIYAHKIDVKIAEIWKEKA